MAAVVYDVDKVGRQRARVVYFLIGSIRGVGVRISGRGHSVRLCGIGEHSSRRWHRGHCLQHCQGLSQRWFASGVTSSDRSSAELFLHVVELVLRTKPNVPGASFRLADVGGSIVHSHLGQRDERLGIVSIQGDEDGAAALEIRPAKFGAGVER